MQALPAKTSHMNIYIFCLCVDWFSAAGLKRVGMLRIILSLNPSETLKLLNELGCDLQSSSFGSSRTELLH